MHHFSHKLFYNQMTSLSSDERKQNEQRDRRATSCEKVVKPAAVSPGGSKHRSGGPQRGTAGHSGQPPYCCGAGLAASQARSCSMRCGSCT